MRAVPSQAGDMLCWLLPRETAIYRRVQPKRHERSTNTVNAEEETKEALAGQYFSQPSTASDKRACACAVVTKLEMARTSRDCRLRVPRHARGPSPIRIKGPFSKLMGSDLACQRSVGIPVLEDQTKEARWQTT
jgi:hypothetical protein